MRHFIFTTGFATCALLLFMNSAAQAAFYGPLNFTEPGQWTVGDSNSTYQLWDEFNFVVENPVDPDAGEWTTNPTLSGSPTLTLGLNGSAFGPDRAYSFTSNYTLTANISNHAQLPGSGLGTHVIIQTATTTNEGVGVILDSIQLFDSNGDAVLGGANSDMLQVGVVSEELINTPQGPAAFQQLIFEFFLPDYTDDFQIQWTQLVHSGFDALRVDTYLSEDAMSLTLVPEPASAMLLAAGSVLLLKRRRG